MESPVPDCIDVVDILSLEEVRMNYSRRVKNYLTLHQASVNTYSVYGQTRTSIPARQKYNQTRCGQCSRQPTYEVVAMIVSFMATNANLHFIVACLSRRCQKIVRIETRQEIIGRSLIINLVSFLYILCPS